jgi:hypothetical protein
MAFFFFLSGSGAPHVLATATLAAALAGCTMDDDPEPAGEGGTTSSTSATSGGGGAPAAAVTGAVSRSAPIARGNDGIGTLFVAALDLCDHVEGQLLGFAVVPQADLSADGAAVPFSIDELPRAAVHLASFLDDNGNADPAVPLPDAGDPVLAGDVHDGLLDCIEVDLSGGDAEDVAIDLNNVED